MKDATVTLPEGLVVNPGQATGLVACQETEASLRVKPDGTENNDAAVVSRQRRGSGRRGSRRRCLKRMKKRNWRAACTCCSPTRRTSSCSSRRSADGVNVKVVGTVHLDEATGRLTATFKNTPQQPVSDIKLSFNGGPQAALITPRACGVYTTTSDFTPWSTPFTPDATPVLAVRGQRRRWWRCLSRAGNRLRPSMVAGMVNNQAGGFSPLSVTLSRQDSEQDGSSVVGDDSSRAAGDAQERGTLR